MKQFIAFLIAVCLYSTGFSQKNENAVLLNSLKESLDLATKQYLAMAKTLVDSSHMLPRTTDNRSKLITSNDYWWTSGFFPGSLWYLYAYSNDVQLKNMAIAFSKKVERQKNTTDNHDVGFMINCSFGNGLKYGKDSSYAQVLITAAKSLSTRFHPKAGIIQSWDIEPWNAKLGWQCPVIIDNMMNLELLMEATKFSGDSSFYKIALRHADMTIQNHFRTDFSSFHVVDYDTLTGAVRKKQTHQGFADESAWARGQAWGLYGFVTIYRHTKEEPYLEQAQKIASFIINHPNMPQDKIPYWDFNAPDIPNAYRDASAGAIICSALIELSSFVNEPLKSIYQKFAIEQITSLSSETYRTKLDENANFLLKHSVGNWPNKSEIDVPLSYADYYYIEAMLRMRNLIKQNLK